MRRTDKVVTREVFQLWMSELKVEQAALQPEHHENEHAQNTCDKSVTADTSHVPISPYVTAAAVGSAHHASRATSSAARSAKTVCPPTISKPNMSSAERPVRARSRRRALRAYTVQRGLARAADERLRRRRLGLGAIALPTS